MAALVSRRISRPAGVALVLLAMLCVPLTVRAADSPAADFETAWAAIDNYTDTIAVHETNGKDTQDRVYRYAYKKPHFAKIDIVSGPGRGSGAVWTGGDHVRGHMGGLLSGIKQTIPITDPRATSLRGDTIEKGSFQTVEDALKTGKVEPAIATATIGGVACDVVTIDLPQTAGGVTRQVVSFSRLTHLPVRRVSFAGDTLVKQEDFSDVKVNPGLTEADFT